VVTYDVWRTLGGNGFWRQRYLTRIGRSVHVLPVQYNEVPGDWIPFRPEDWYDGNGAPRFGDPATVAAEIDPSYSFDLKCVGCHATGVEIEFEAAGGQYVTGYQELTIGCEACHGPGQDHVDSGGDTTMILNPADLLDGTPDGVLAANLVCGRCHVAGEGGIPAGGADPTGYPWREGGSTFPPGSRDFEDYFTVTSDPDDYWRRKDNPLGLALTPDDPKDDTFLAARSAELQYPDLENGPHGSNGPSQVTCFDCHDPHSRAQRHQLRSELTVGGDTFTDLAEETNGLCLACHRGAGDFAAVTVADVNGLAGDPATPAVVNAVIAHMKDKAAMPIDPGDYDAAGDGTGRCSSCHVLLLAESAAHMTDAAGNRVGDIHSHTFNTVWPSVSELTAPRVTNSCTGCHLPDPGDLAAAVIGEWVSDPDADGTFHADTPQNSHTEVVNEGRAGGVACVSCHTTEGFLAVQVNGTDIHDLAAPGDADARIAIVKDALKRDVGITCRACHGRGPNGSFGSGDNPLRFPKNELCGRCHNNYTILEEDYRLRGEIVGHPQREMMAGLDGGEVSGETYTNTSHTVLAGSDCTQCHYRSGTPRKHDFTATIESCHACHPGLSDINLPAGGDYDGDGTTEGIQDEVDGALEVLRAAILATAPSGAPDIEITFDDPYFLINDTTDPGTDPSKSATVLLDPVQDEALMRAMFNHYWVDFDGSRGIHNASYALQLLQTSYEEITGQAWPGDVR
jgi:hypothetical protein